jgi:type I restriction enzyme S subunit
MKRYEEYKDSGVEWIGEIPVYWKLKKLKYSITIKSGNGITNEELIPNGDYNVYGGNGVLGKTNRFNTESEDLIIGRVGALCGNIHFISGKKWVSDNALYAQVKDGSCKYYEYYLKFLDLNRLANKNAQPLITGTMVREQYVGMPESLEEQTQIANYLDHKTKQIDDLIAKKEKLIELLKEERTATINQTVTKGIDPNVPMKDSGIEWLGEVPEHWKISKLKFLSEIISKGTTPSTIGKEMIADGVIKFIKAENINDNKLETHPIFYIDDETHNILKRSQLKKKDILIVIAGATIGKVAIMYEEYLPANTNQAVCFIRLREKQYAEFLWYWLQSKFIKEAINRDATQAAQPNLSMEDIGNFIIPLIPEVDVVIDYISTSFEKIDHKIMKALEQIKLLKEYKTALISEVVTGKVDVRDEKIN